MNSINPFGNAPQALVTQGQVDQQRALAEVQMQVAMAKKFPRDPRQCMDKIIQACTRPTLAEEAEFEFERGNETITGATIVLMKAIAQQWGNLSFGIREISNNLEEGVSEVETFCWDLETNSRESKVFHVTHTRYRRPEKGGPIQLTDPRDIYELVANQGSRRLRTCIEGIIPRDVIDAARRQCKITLEAEGCTQEQIDFVVERFASVGITPEMIARRLDHPLKDMTTAELVQLRRVYQSIAGGFVKPGEFFEDVPEEDALSEEEKEQSNKLRQKVETKRAQKKIAQERKAAAQKQSEGQKKAEERKQEEGGKAETPSSDVETEEKPKSKTRKPPPQVKPISIDDWERPDWLPKGEIKAQGARGWPVKVAGKWWDSRGKSIKCESEEEATSRGLGWNREGQHPAIIFQTGAFAKKRASRTSPSAPATKTEPPPQNQVPQVNPDDEFFDGME